MIPIIKQLNTPAVRVSRWVIPTHAVYLVVFAILLVCPTSINTVINHERLFNSYYYSPVLVNAIRALSVAANAVEVFGILMVDASMLMLLVQSRIYWPRASHLSRLFMRCLSSNPWQTLSARIVSLAVAALALSVTDLAAAASNYFNYSTSYAVRSYNATVFLRHFFYSCTFVLVLSIGAFHLAPDIAAPAGPVVYPNMSGQQHYQVQAQYQQPPSQYQQAPSQYQQPTSHYQQPSSQTHQQPPHW